MNTKLERDMKFVLLYKGITLTVQVKCVKCLKCVKCTRVYKTPNRFCTIFKQLELDIKMIIDIYIFFYQTMSLIFFLQKLTCKK